MDHLADTRQWPANYASTTFAMDTAAYKEPSITRPQGSTKPAVRGKRVNFHGAAKDTTMSINGLELGDVEIPNIQIEGSSAAEDEIPVSRRMTIHRTSLFIRKDKPRCKRRPLQVALLSLNLILVLVQLCLFNVFFVLYGDEHPEKFFSHERAEVNCSHIDSAQQAHHSFEYLVYFLAPDMIAVFAMAWLPICAMRQYLTERNSQIVHCGKLDLSLRYAGICYGLYAIALVCKVSVSSKSFLMVLQFIQGCGVHRTFGVNSFILIQGLTCLVFFTIVFAHHAHNLIVEEWLKRLIEKITFDLLDGIHFLQILFTNEAVEFMFLHPALENTIIALSCINIFLPALSLFKLRHKIVTIQEDDPVLKTTQSSPDQTRRSSRNGSLPANDLSLPTVSDLVQNGTHTANLEHALSSNKKTLTLGLAAPPLKATKVENWTAYLEEEGYNFIFLVLINLPYLIIRSYLWHIMGLEVSVFILKNTIEIVIQTTKIVQGVRNFRKW